MLRRTRNGRWLALGLILSLAFATTASASSPQRPTPMPGQAAMTDAEIASSLATMDAREREQTGLRMEDPSILSLKYVRGYFKVMPDKYGTLTLQQVETPLPEMLASVSSSTRYYDLYLSLYVGRTGYAGYEYLVETYFDWRSGYGSMHKCNVAKDFTAVAWGNANLSAGSRGTSSGMYWDTNTFVTSPYALDIAKADQTPNVGVSWSFHEWQNFGAFCSQLYASEWGRSSLYLRSATFNNISTDFVAKYFHTWNSQAYTIGFSATPQITITPTINEWEAVLAVDLIT